MTAKPRLNWKRWPEEKPDIGKDIVRMIYWGAMPAHDLSVGFVDANHPNSWFFNFRSHHDDRYDEYERIEDGARWFWIYESDLLETLPGGEDE